MLPFFVLLLPTLLFLLLLLLLLVLLLQLFKLLLLLLFCFVFCFAVATGVVTETVVKMQQTQIVEGGAVGPTVVATARVRQQTILQTSMANDVD